MYIRMKQNPKPTDLAVASINIIGHTLEFGVLRKDIN